MFILPHSFPIDCSDTLPVRQLGRPMSPKVDGRRFKFPRMHKGKQPNHDSIGQVLDSPVQTSVDSPRRGPLARRHNVNISTLSDDIHTPLSPSPKNRTLSVQSQANGNEVFWLSSINEGSPIERCVSPEELYCTGWCKHLPEPNKQFANVISLSAAKDGERAWEDSQGCSMTQVCSPLARFSSARGADHLLPISQCLVRILRMFLVPFSILRFVQLALCARQKPSSYSSRSADVCQVCRHSSTCTLPCTSSANPRLFGSHELHVLYLDIHAKSRDYRKKARAANLKRLAKGLLARMPDQVEMDNFQNPQVCRLDRLPEIFLWLTLWVFSVVGRYRACTLW